MLSFLRDQGYEDLPAQKAGAKAAEGKKPSEQAYIAVSTNTQKVRRSTTVLAVLFVVGLACVWYMVKKSSPQAATAADTEMAELEVSVSGLTGIRSEMFDEMGQIVNKFYEFSDVPQVKVSELVKNPFELEMYLANLSPGTVQNVLEIDTDAIKRQQIKKKSDELELFTIMQSEGKNCCMIDSKVLYEGDSLGDFRVTNIESNFVKLVWDPKDKTQRLKPGSEDVEVILKLSE